MLIKFCHPHEIFKFALMKIESYIAQLLYRYQCVTVPGFGAFLTETQSAHWNSSAHTFYPPKKVISFNAYLKNNDGLLANHIAVAEKIPYEVAVTVIEHAVHDWKQKLQDFGSIALRQIGEISLNSDKNLVFVPQDQVNYLTESFGLSAVVSPYVQREILNQITEETPVEVQVTEQEVDVLPLATPERSSNFLKYAAIFVVSAGLLGAGGYFGNQYYTQKIEAETLAVQTKVQKKIEEKIQQATFVLDNPTTPVLPAVTLTIKSDKLPYHVVAGAFRLEENADRVLYELKKLGYPARKLKPNKHGLYPVLYASYSSYTVAQQKMQEIQKSHNPEAWVLIEEQ
ncbi:MAG: hypothetical protein RL607_1092 [Bacteroidota bacterium]